MKHISPILLAVTLSFVSCSRATNQAGLTPEQSDEVTRSVRAFVAAVAGDVTRQGPAGWQAAFSDTPNFFMASEGRLVFANNDEAKSEIQKLTTVISKLELSWGETLKIDPLSSNLAMVGMSYHEVQIDAGGHRVEENGYFTGLAQREAAGWRFRNAHWSVLTPPSKLP